MGRTRTELVEMVDRALSEVPKEALIGSRELELELDWLFERAVALARREGYEWARIGRLIGRSRQAVRQRFASIVPAVPPSLRRRELMDRYRSEIRRQAADVRRRAEADSDDDPVAW